MIAAAIASAIGVFWWHQGMTHHDDTQIILGNIWLAAGMVIGQIYIQRK